MSQDVARPMLDKAASAQPLPGRLQVPAPALRTWLDVLLLLALCGILFFYGVNAGELYRTESLRAIIAAEFLHSGNWVVPKLYGEPLFTKPPGMYAAIALLSSPFGEVQDWTSRLPSAMAASTAVFLFYWYFCRQLGRSAGLMAAVILPISLMWLDKATAAEIDMMQVAWITGAILFFLRGLEAVEGQDLRRRVQEVDIKAWRVQETSTGLEISDSDSNYSPDAPKPGLFGGVWLWWLAALICVAGGVLTKWTAPAFFYGTVIPLLWRRGQLRLLWSRQHLFSVALGAGLCLAWMATAVALTGWHTFYDTVSREALMRLLPSHHHRPYPWLESLAHPFKVLGAGLPWSSVALLTLWPGFAAKLDDRGRRLLQALHCWLWPNLLFWSVIPEHAMRHSFPLLPAIAGLAALVWVAWMSALRKKAEAHWQRIAASPRLPKRRSVALPTAILLGILALWVGVKIVFVEKIVPARNLNREPRAKGELLARLVPEGKTLFLSRLKDEGIMFYYGRQVLRLESFAKLPASANPWYCILDDSEWRKWPAERPAVVIERLLDEQGAPIVLVKLEK